MRRPLIIEIVAAALIILLVYAALTKLLSYSVFVTQLYTHPLLKHFAGILAWAVPAVELMVAILLFIPRTRKPGFAGALALMTTFTFYIAGMLLFETHLPCSCGGALQSLTWKQHLVLNLVFALLALTGLKLKKSSHPTKWNMRHSSPP